MTTISKNKKNVNIRFPLSKRQVTGAVIVGIYFGVIFSMMYLSQFDGDAYKTGARGPTGYPVWTYRGPGRISEPTPTQTPTPGIVRGRASYYSRAGCLGCSPTLTMANGKPLDDAGMTVAYNRAPLGTKLIITNEESGQSAQAVVTDTGGFERHGKIVDLTIAVRDAIGCGSSCTVIIEIMEE